MDTSLARALIEDMPETHLREIMIHLLIRIKLHNHVDWIDLVDLIDKAIASNRPIRTTTQQET